MTKGTVADHVMPHRGDPVLFWQGELQTLCDTCHNAVKQAQEKSGVLRGAALDGSPLDPSHHWNAPGGGSHAATLPAETAGVFFSG